MGNDIIVYANFQPKRANSRKPDNYLGNIIRFKRRTSPRDIRINDIRQMFNLPPCPHTTQCLLNIDKNGPAKEKCPHCNACKRIKNLLL